MRIPPTIASANDLRLDGTVRVSFAHRVRFVRGAMRSVDGRPSPLASAIAEATADDGGFRGRLLPVLDSNLARAQPALASSIADALRAGGAAMPEVLPALVVPGGEQAKNDPAVLEAILDALDRGRVCRRSILLAAGGGAVLDVAGFAAATFHRGVRLVRLPTTTLAQDDAAMGVKNGVNRGGKKNLLGAFAVPSAVLCDLELLRTLPDREFLAGFSEAVKIAVIRDAALLERIERDAAAIRARDEDAAEAVIRRCAELHLRHILEGGDPFETGTARPLDFGHWSAHRLESMTSHRILHGEAVAVGIALDATIAALESRLDRASARRIILALRALGLPTWDDALREATDLLAGLEEFREHLGGAASLAMPTRIGASTDAPPPTAALVRRAIEELARS